jgi:hypothetical protein
MSIAGINSFIKVVEGGTTKSTMASNTRVLAIGRPYHWKPVSEYHTNGAMDQAM